MGEYVLRSFGAARTVTGSRHLLTTPHARILLDCGLFQGRRDESRERNRHVGCEADVVVLSHAHIDHSGALPSLVRDGFRGPIHATGATRDLCAAMLMDCAKINEADARHLNKRREKGEREIVPIYTRKDVERTMDRFVMHEYDEPFEVAKGTRVTFRDAGHILGSAGVLLENEDGPTIYFTGDLGRRMYPILRDPEPLPDADVVLSESTYGTRDHEPVDLAESKLHAVLQRAINRKGKVFIPAFSVGRTQNLIYALAKMRKAGTIPEIPVVVDSPLAEKATRVFAGHRECYDQEILDFLSEGGRPFYPRWLRYTAKRAESIALNDADGPLVILAGSGMCEGGRIAHHLKHGLANEDNTVLFVGWCAPHTLGRRIVEKRPEVRIFGRTVKVRAHIASLRAYSAHADRTGLLEFLQPAADRGTRIFLVHGDEDTALAFADALREQGHGDVVVPETYAPYVLERRSKSKSS
ncbi:MAG: MBL fold metallo-hydrolase [Planctomycetota bacterium]|nr:MBL fold metallo-hydrolase [Planctomycetota bacterium]